MNTNSVTSLQKLPTKQSSLKNIICFLALLLLLFWTSTSPFLSIVKAIQQFLILAIIILVVVCCMYLPDGFITRPSQYLWKAITGISFFYFIVLTCFLCLDRTTVIQVIHTYFDTTLQTFNYEQESYGSDCRIYASGEADPFSNLKNTFFDIFAFAHAAGWLCKTMVVRDLKLILISSFVFEILQFSLRNVLNNFKQCWWDHLVVDIFGCNLFGIIVGFYVIDYFKLERYRWSLRDAPFHSRALSQIKYFFTHWDLSKFETKSLSTLGKFMQLVWYIAFIQINDLNGFFLKYIYGIPPSNYLVIFRILFVGLLCVNASKEYYRFILKKTKEIRVNCFLANLIIFVEIMLIFKHGNGLFDHAYLTISGVVLLGILLVIFLLILIKVSISDTIRWRKEEERIQCEKQMVKIDKCI